jgi:hypothetical protein
VQPSFSFVLKVLMLTITLRLSSLCSHHASNLVFLPHLLFFYVDFVKARQLDNKFQAMDEVRRAAATALLKVISHARLSSNGRARAFALLAQNSCFQG